MGIWMASEARSGWQTHEIEGRRVEVYLPSQWGEAAEHGSQDIRRDRAVLYLHDQRGQSPRNFNSLVEKLEQHQLPLLVPYAGPTWWTERLTQQFDATLSPRRYLLDRVLPFAQSLLGIAPPRIALLGYRMGAQGALGLAYRHPDLFPVVAAVTPAIDFQLLVAQGDPVLMELYEDPEAARQDTVILHIHPLNWPRHQFFCCDPADPHWFASADRLRMKLGSIGIPHESDLQSTFAEEADYVRAAMPRALDFIAERLEQDRLRVI
jgi:pimeloyl-ACP methyl ester carboxylesterase